MSNLKTKKISAGTIAIMVWLAINAVFMALEVTVFNDAADPNNSILLVLSIASIAGLVFAGKYGMVLTTFTVIYAFSFNSFNLLYFGISQLNLVSALVNALATVFLFSTLIKRA
jgi:hypothetical protein